MPCPADHEQLKSLPEATGADGGACSRERHAELMADPGRRARETRSIGEMHDDGLAIHLAMRNCMRCESTLVVLLPGHLEVGQ